MGYRSVHCGWEGQYLTSAAIALITIAVPSLSRGASADQCMESGPPVLERQWKQRGSTTVHVDVPATPGRDLFVRADEQGVDIEMEFLDHDAVVIARSDSPVDRRATQRAYFSQGSKPAVLLVKAKQPASFEGVVHLKVTAIDPTPGVLDSQTVECAAAVRLWAVADAVYDTGHTIELGRTVSSNPGEARAAFEKAAHVYREALDHLGGRAFSTDRGDLELTLAALAYYELQDWSGSASWAARSEATFAKAGDKYKQARARAILAAAWMELATKSTTAQQSTGTPKEAKDRLKAARALLGRVAKFHSLRNERYDQTLQINNIGLAYYYEARFEAAMPYFLRAIRAYGLLGERTHEGVALQNLALCDWGIGHLSSALNSFGRALALIDAPSNPHLYLATLNNSGLAHYAAGQFDEALRLQTTALEVATRTQVDRARARSYYGIGVTYYAIGDRQLAAEFLKQALDLCPPELDARVRVATLRALARTEYDTGGYVEAIGHDSEALRLATAPSARARIVLRVAQDYLALGENGRASQLLDELIVHPTSNDALVPAMARVQRANLLRENGSLDIAEQLLVQALKTLEQFDELAERFEAQVILARLQADRGHVAKALETVRAALYLSREIRTQTANPEYRSSIVESIRPAIALDIDLLRSQYESRVREVDLRAARSLAIESLEVADQFRAMGFEEWRAEYLDRHSDTRIAHLLATSDALYHEMAERRYQLEVREDRGGSDDIRARILRESIARLRVRLGLVNAEVATLSGAAGRANNSVIDVRKLAFGATTGHAFVEYWLGSKQAYAWVINGPQISWVALSPSKEIDGVARGLHGSLRSPFTVSEALRREKCAELYRLVVAPITEALQSAQQLTIVPDGALHYVPFVALRSAEKESTYVTQRFVVSLAPALRFLADSQIATALPKDERLATRVLLVSDPVYAPDDARLSAAKVSRVEERPVELKFRAFRGSVMGLKFARLVSSARETDQIRALFPANQVDTLQGIDATRGQFLSRDLSSYRFIHIASHGLIDAEIPQLSALVLGVYGSQGAAEDPYIRAGDFLTRTFHAQAIVLSSCDTALGREYLSEGLIGLRYAALARGAHAVVASLWPVSDGIAADLMTDMYRELNAIDNYRGEHWPLSSSLAVAAALATAMRHELHRAPTLDPALWAPFSVYIASN